MQIGIFLTMPSPAHEAASIVYARGLDVACEAEQLGFSHVWLAEHHFTNYAYTSRPLLLLSHIAARTRRIRLGTAIIQVPLHHPLVVAEEIATLDVLSGGRVEAGLGKGYQRYQSARLGDGRRAVEGAFDDALALIRRALHEPVFSFEGRAFDVPRTRLFPAPVQPRVPLWLVVNTSVRESVEQAVAAGMNLFTGVLEPIGALTDVRARYPDLAPALAGLRIGTQRPVFVAATEAQAREAVEEVRWNGRATVQLRHGLAEIDDGVLRVAPLAGEPDTDALLSEHVVAGTAEQCVEQLRRIQSGLGCDYFSASFWFGGLSQARVLDSMRRFARDVMPAFHHGRAAAPRAARPEFAA
jgi:alkanesulfonate monooxygenase SsuD/methylene tetrahydromethanopterin reductase-like flavin-dependent oxidoreductase (luciferase family)